jgi:hypothetical protein
MTNPTDNDTDTSAAEEVSGQQPVANPDAVPEADQDAPDATSSTYDENDASPSNGPAI